MPPETSAVPIETERSHSPLGRVQIDGAKHDQNRWTGDATEMPEGHSRRLQWILFTGCWVGYGLTLLAGALPWVSEPGFLVSHLLYLICTLPCGIPVWIFCHRLWQRRWSWPKAMLATAAFCYPLGCISTLCSNWLANPYQSKKESLPDILLSAFSASSPYCALVVCGGLYFGLRQYERGTRVEALAREAQLRTLRYQLTPHFLCNTLNGISTLVGEGHAQDARRMIARLGDFLRTTLEGAGMLEVSVAQEISYVEQYLAIEQVRLGERLEVKFSVAPETLDAGVPNLILQPLVENAVQHGIVPFRAGGTLSIRVERQAEQIHFTVHNQCHHAAPPITAENPETMLAETVGLGLRNTAERLWVAYGIAAQIECHRDAAGSWTVFIALPYYPWLDKTGKDTAA